LGRDVCRNGDEVKRRWTLPLPNLAFELKFKITHHDQRGRWLVWNAMESDGTPFAALTLIIAPAMLTNACSVLILSTSNRLARTIDRARALVHQIETALPEAVPHLIETQRATEARAITLTKALRLTYAALGGFVGSACASVFGVLAASGPTVLEAALQGLAILVGTGGVIGMMAAALLLVHESRTAVMHLQRESEEMERRRRESTVRYSSSSES
jgi:hypothetical protein